MSIWRSILQAAADAVRSEARYRRNHPNETADMFRRREAHWRSRGRKRLAKIAARRAERWERIAAQGKGD